MPSRLPQSTFSGHYILFLVLLALCADGTSMSDEFVDWGIFKRGVLSGRDNALGFHKSILLSLRLGVGKFCFRRRIHRTPNRFLTYLKFVFAGQGDIGFMAERCK